MDLSPTIIITPRKALSQNARGKSKYQDALAEDARKVVVSPLTSTRLYSKVFYFYRGKADGDADNKSKPILDALRGVVYKDDCQVVLRIVAQIALDVDVYEVVQKGIDPGLYQKLIDLIAQETNVLYIEVGELDKFPLSLGVV